MDVIDGTKYIRLQEIRDMTGKHITVETFGKMFPQYPVIKIKNTYCFSYTGNRTETLNQISDAIMKHHALKNLDNPYDKVDCMLNQYDGEMHTKYPVLFETFKAFVYGRITDSRRSKKNLMAMASTCISLFKYLLQYMENKNTAGSSMDIDKMTELDICRIVADKDMPITYAMYLGYYIEYLKDNNKTSINITIQVRRDGKIKNDSDFYSMEEWSGFVNFAMDIDRHIQKAFNNITYARCWLYLLLHLCLAWRKSDILSMAGLNNLSGIEQYDLHWFEENTFYMENASHIIDNTKMYVEQYLTHKTSAYKHFNIPDVFKIPIAISIIITEQWRRRAKNELLFGDGNFSSGHTMSKHLGKTMDIFSSIKANRTLLSFTDSMAEKTGANEYVRISSYMRSHKTNYYNMSDTTSIYLHSMYSDAELNEITIQLYDRGMFGWLYDSLLKAVSDEKVPPEKRTADIVQMKQGISADRLELFSGLFNQQSVTKENVINEILKLSQDGIKNVIVKLADGSLTSRQDGVMCIREDDCRYPVRTDCINCEYSIPTVYTLTSVCAELNNIFQEAISPCEYDRIRTINKMIKLYSVIKEAEKTFGNEYVNFYTDLSVLKQKFCETYKMLSAKDEDKIEGGDYYKNNKNE